MSKVVRIDSLINKLTAIKKRHGNVRVLIDSSSVDESIPNHDALDKLILEFTEIGWDKENKGVVFSSARYK